MDIHKELEEVNDQKGFCLFLEKLKIDYTLNVELWENNDLTSFLDGLHGYCLDKEQNELSWKVVAEMLLAARVYE